MPSFPAPSALELEEIAFRAWPARVMEERAGFRVRYTGGVTRRANSAWGGGPDGGALPDRVATVEEFYREHGVVPRFQIVEGVSPAGLDAVLEERGYVIEARTLIETAEVESFRFAGQPPQLMTRVLPAPDADFLHVTVERGRFAGREAEYLGLLQRIGDKAGFAVARRSGAPIAVGLGVVDVSWLGVFSMATLPEERRQYAATAVLAALVGWGAARGATRVYLQVEPDNEAALALYSRSGFTPAYSYHYRTGSL